MTSKYSWVWEAITNFFGFSHNRLQIIRLVLLGRGFCNLGLNYERARGKLIRGWCVRVI
jgi:hypothetical protein